MKRICKEVPLLKRLNSVKIDMMMGIVVRKSIK